MILKRFYAVSLRESTKSGFMAQNSFKMDKKIFVRHKKYKAAVQTS